MRGCNILLRTEIHAIIIPGGNGRRRIPIAIAPIEPRCDCVY